MEPGDTSCLKSPNGVTIAGCPGHCTVTSHLPSAALFNSSQLSRMQKTVGVMPEASPPLFQQQGHTSMVGGESGCQGRGEGGEVKGVGQVFESPFNTEKMGKLLLCVDLAGAPVAVEKVRRKS